MHDVKGRARPPGSTTQRASLGRWWQRCGGGSSPARAFVGLAYDRSATKPRITARAESLGAAAATAIARAYDQVAATARLEELLAEVDRGPTAIFWG